MANQTTIYKKETRSIGQIIHKTMISKYTPNQINDRYYKFNTISNATQVHQDAMDNLSKMNTDPTKPDLDFIQIVNDLDFPNTAHLLEIPQEHGMRFFRINTSDYIAADN